MRTFCLGIRKRLWLIILSFLLIIPVKVDAATSIISSDANSHVYQHTHDGNCPTSPCPGWLGHGSPYGSTASHRTSYEYGPDGLGAYCHWVCQACGKEHWLPDYNNEWVEIHCDSVMYSCGYEEGQTWQEGHTNTTVTDSNATCTAPQYAHNHCTTCGYNSAQFPVGSRLGHVWTQANSVVTKEPTVYDSGIRTFTCSRDGSHKAAMEEPKRLFRLFGNEKRIQRLYRGDTLIYDVCAGNFRLTVPGGTAALPAP